MPHVRDTDWGGAVAKRQTGPEIRDEYVVLMGEPLGLAYNVLRNDLTLAYAYWKVYRELYTDEERLAVLNDSAGTLFFLLQSLLLHGVLLQLAVLVDRPATRDKKNLTLRSLPSLVAPELQSRLESLISSACGSCDSVVAWRNRRLAHRDHDVALEAVDLPEVPFTGIDDALESAARVLNCVEAHYNKNASVAYGMVELGGSADSLVYFLRKGLDAEREAVEGL